MIKYNKKLVFAFLLTLFFAILSLVYINFNSNSNYIFLNKKDTISFFKNDEDHYVRNMTKYDLKCRNSNTAKEYIDRICECVVDFTEDEKNRLVKCANKADSFFANYKYMNKLNCKTLLKIRWKFALTSKNKYGEDYEEGLPHTRKDIIFLSKSEISHNENDIILTSTLIHEKIHIYQRYNTRTMDILIKDMGYIEYNRGNTSKLKRTNPDINDKTYYDASNNKIMLIEYNSEEPNSINDIKTSDYKYEHPYEKMAYEIQNEYTRYEMNNITKNI